MSEVEVILGNSNRRFSGVTSTMLATLPGVSRKVSVAVLGGHFVPEGYQVLGYGDFIRLCREPLSDGRWRVFHARRNDEMIQALLAKWIFRAKIRIVFTSTAQRHHSRFTKWLIRQMDGVITTCKAAKSYLEREPDVMIPHGVSLDEFCPAEDRKALWDSLGHGGDYGIGMFGRVRPSKGVDLLVRAAIPLMREDPKPTIVIIGKTTPKFASFQEELQKEIDEAGLSERILFLGELPFSEVKTYFQAVSLVTALSRNEGFGLTVLEAMASGTAVLASEAGAWKDILAETFPEQLVRTGDLQSAKEALESILEGKRDLGAFGGRARVLAESCYSIDREARALVDYYQRMNF